MRLSSRQMLHDYRSECKAALDRQKIKILVCGGRGCFAAGSQEVYESLKRELEERGLPVELSIVDHVEHPEPIGLKLSGCHGLCALAPLIRIEPAGLLYMRVSPDDAGEIVEQTILGGDIIDRLVFQDENGAYPLQKDIPFFKGQKKVALENCGHIAAESIEEYFAVGGYSSLEKAARTRRCGLPHRQEVVAGRGAQGRSR